jgi:hypothetical protein
MTAAAFVAAVVVLVLFTLPARRQELQPIGDGTVAGILHVHTNRSDGLQGPDEVAAAASRAGLKFVIFTDHGDGTRPPDPPTYRSGVLCLDGVEISTKGGHYVAIDMPASPYPLGGDARDVVEDVKRLGGFGIAAHPDSPKPELRWRDWDAPFDSIELLNLDTSWRVLAQRPGVESKWQILRALVDYAIRSPEVMASLIQPSEAVQQWEALARRRRVVTVAAADAHSKLALRNADPWNTRLAVPLPSYESSFRTLSVHVRIDQPLTGAAAQDASIILRNLRSGHLYAAIDGLATPPAFEFTATNALGTVQQGDQLGPGGPVRLHVRSNAPPSFTTVVHAGAGTITAARDAQDLTVHASDEPAVYWVEIVSTGSAHEIAWIRSNAIYVRGLTGEAKAPARPPPTSSRPLFDGRTTAGWRTELSRSSTASLDVSTGADGSALGARYQLPAGAPAGQFVAFVHDLSAGSAEYDRIGLSARADHPMRVSIQFRTDAGDRWQRSIYLDTFETDRTILLDEATPVDEASGPRPSPASVRSILIVIDTTNTRPGTSGRILITRAELQGAR